MPFLEALIPSSVVAWYPLADVTEIGLVAEVTDESGAGRDLLPTGVGVDVPNYVLDSINGYPSIFFNEESPLFYNAGGTLAVKDIFALAKFDGGATFGGNEQGLLSDAATNPLFLGQQSTSKFYNLSPLVYTYRKSKTIFLPANMQAPMDDFELIELSSTSGWSLDGIMLGQDRGDPTRRWEGNVADLILFSSELTEGERKRVELYFDLKYKLYLLTETNLNFPSQEITGLVYAHCEQIKTDWQAITRSHEYEDGGRSFIETASNAPKRWRIQWTGLSAAEREIFDTFYDEVRYINTFDYTHRDGTLYEGVRIENYEASHTKTWNNTCEFTLVKYP